ncbi:MAG TPA: hypothetical protein VF771_08800, partial [Longimicrobiaceae bacterium]
MKARSLPMLLTAALVLAGCESSTAAGLRRNTFTATITGDRTFTLTGHTGLAIPEVVVVVMPGSS